MLRHQKAAQSFLQNSTAATCCVLETVVSLVVVVVAEFVARRCCTGQVELLKLAIVIVSGCLSVQKTYNEKWSKHALRADGFMVIFYVSSKGAKNTAVIIKCDKISENCP